MTHTATVQRFVEEAINGGRDELIDDVFDPGQIASARDWFGSFRRAFPDLHMDVKALVAEGDTVVGRFTCSATHLGPWREHPPTGRRFEDVDEVYFFTFKDDRIASFWGIEDTLDRYRQLGLDPNGP
jgi:predicted ester cyclase